MVAWPPIPPDEFNAWWDQDARRLAAVIKRIGKVEST
jgi:hypothetical protein